MSRAYYKTSAPEVMAVLKERNDKVAALGKLGKAFAEHFGGELIVNNGIHGYRISGLRFDPKKSPRLWTHPDQKSLGQQRPRQSITKATPEEKAELASLKAEWKQHFPVGDVPFEPVLEAIGTSWGELCFGGGFAMRQTDDAMYVATSAKLNEHMVEIMASEYAAAEAQAKAEEARAATEPKE